MNPGIAAGCRRRRFDDHLDRAAIGDRQHAKAEPAAEIAIARVALAALAARRHFGGNPDLIGSAGAIDRLQDELEIEGLLQFADHDGRWLTVGDVVELEVEGIGTLRNRVGPSRGGLAGPSGSEGGPR